MGTPGVWSGYVPQPPLSRKDAIDGLRDAYLRLKYILCLNELEDDQKWITQFLTISSRKMGRMLRHLEPKRRLPTVLKDTKLGRSIQEARRDQKAGRLKSYTSLDDLLRSNGKK